MLRSVLEKLLQRPRAVVALGFALSAPALLGGYNTDDFVHHAMARGKTPGLSSHPLEMYHFFSPEKNGALRDSGTLPWWTYDDLQAEFFRPLGSASLAIDHQLLPPWLGHLHSLFWFLLLLLAAQRVLALILPEREARYATLLYVIAGAHTILSGWIAARAGLMAASFGMWAIWAHLRWREHAWVHGSWLAPLFFVASLCCAETGVGSLAIVGCHELCGYRHGNGAVGSRRPRRGSIGRRALLLLPYAALFIAYLLFYKLSGHGVRNSGLYVSPLHDPAEFAQLAVVALPLFAGDAILGVPAMIPSMQPHLLPIWIGLGCLATLLLAYCARALRQRSKELVWLMVGGALAALPAAGGVPGGRALPFTLLATCALLGSCWSRASNAPPIRRRVTLGLVGSFVVISSLWRLGFGGLSVVVAGVQLDMADQVKAACPAQSTALVISSDPYLGMYGSAILDARHPNHLQGSYVLSMAVADHQLTRTSPTTLELQVLNESTLNGSTPQRTETLFEKLLRPPSAPLAPGSEVAAGPLHIQVLQTTPTGLFTALKVSSQHPEPNWCLVTWRGAHIERVELPTPGQPLDLPHQPGPLGM